MNEVMDLIREARCLHIFLSRDRSRIACRSPYSTCALSALRGAFTLQQEMANARCTSTCLIALLLVCFTSPVISAISTTAPLPPLQWLNITRLLSGPSAPPLKSASLGYDDTTRSLLIFGGESEGGFAQANTYMSVTQYRA